MRLLRDSLILIFLVAFIVLLRIPLSLKAERFLRWEGSILIKEWHFAICEN